MWSVNVRALCQSCLHQLHQFTCIHYLSRGNWFISGSISPQGSWTNYTATVVVWKYFKIFPLYQIYRTLWNQNTYCMLYSFFKVLLHFHNLKPSTYTHKHWHTALYAFSSFFVCVCVFVEEAAFPQRVGVVCVFGFLWRTIDPACRFVSATTTLDERPTLDLYTQRPHSAPTPTRLSVHGNSHHPRLRRLESPHEHMDHVMKMTWLRHLPLL